MVPRIASQILSRFLGNSDVQVSLGTTGFRGLLGSVQALALLSLSEKNGNNLSTRPINGCEIGCNSTYKGLRTPSSTCYLLSK